MSRSPKITPFLWFDKDAAAAAKFYASIFKRSKVTSVSKLEDTPSGTVEIVQAELWGQPFSLMSAGPLFKFNPSVSFLVACSSKKEVDALWKKLSEGGTALMELGAYPFSARYGWVADKFGLSWQVMDMGDRKIRQRIVPSLMFVGERCGQAEKAVKFYESTFGKAKVRDIMRYGKGEEPDKKGTVKHASFRLEGQEFAVMDSAGPHKFDFNEAISFIIGCKGQKEVDYYWKKLSADPKAEQCGWLKDRFGVSWQVVPSILGKMLGDKDKRKVARVRDAFLKMKKFDVKALKRAFKADPA